MTRICLSLCIFAGLSAILPFAAVAEDKPAPAAANPERIPAVTDEPAPAVTVNGKSLSADDVRTRMGDILARQGVPAEMQAQILGQYGDKIQKQVIDDFINDVLLDAELTNRAVTVAADVVESALAEIKKNLPKDMTLEKAIESEGMTVDDLRANIVETEKRRALYKTMTEGIVPVTEKQAAAFYEENKQRFVSEEEAAARHILIACGVDEGEAEHKAAREKIDTIRKQLVDGADFAATAQASSDCPSKKEGGSLGSFGRGRMVPEFEKAAFTQDIDQIGPVIKTQFGYHVVQVTERQNAATQSLDSVSADIRENLEESARREKFQDFIDSLRAKAEIVISESH